jgi:hypothetical protein
MDVNLRRFGSCHDSAVTTEFFFRKHGMDKIDSKNGGISIHYNFHFIYIYIYSTYIWLPNGLYVILAPGDR